MLSLGFRASDLAAGLIGAIGYRVHVSADAGVTFAHARFLPVLLHGLTQPCPFITYVLAKILTLGEE